MNNKENYKKFISEDEEIRNGFKVTSNRKKVWNIELGLLEELKRICEKHNIKYYTSGGTMLGAIRHKGFIPRDDDMDLLMFREDYDKFWEIAPNELPNYIKLSYYHQGYSKLINTNTTALGDENWWDKDFVGGIRIDIFPMDGASRLMVVNRLKSKILIFLRIILLSQKCYGFVHRMKKWKKLCVYLCKFIFKKFDCGRIYQIHEKISRKVFLRGDDIYTGRCPYLFYPKNIFDKTLNIEFENTTISVPSGYDVFLKKQYGNYMKPVIWQGGHSCRYCVNKSYRDIIKSFDKSITNEENYNNCKDLFGL